MVLAAICYAGAAIFGRGFKDLDPMAPAAGSLLAGAAILVPVSLVVDRPWTLVPSMSSVLALLGLAVFSTAMALVIYFRLIQTLGSVGTTAQAYLRVPIGVALGVLFLDERPICDRMDRARLRRDRCRRDDDPGAEGEADQASRVSAQLTRALLSQPTWRWRSADRFDPNHGAISDVHSNSPRCPSQVGAKAVREAGITAD